MPAWCRDGGQSIDIAHEGRSFDETDLTQKQAPSPKRGDIRTKEACKRKYEKS